MKPLGFYWAHFWSSLTRSREPLNRYFRSKGVKIGQGCVLCSCIVTKESHLIEIGSDVTVSANVTFVTHDNSVRLVHPDKTDLFGKIVIGDHCFIGQNVTLLYGVTLGPRIIVAAGAVVTKSFTEENIIIGGNPARKIGTWEDFKRKSAPYAIRREELNQLLAVDDSCLVKR